MASVEPGASSAIWRGVAALASLVRYTVTSGSTATRAGTPSPGSSSTATTARRPYRDGQEDQLGALGFALNALVLWNAQCLDDANAQLRATVHQITDEDLRRLSPLQHEQAHQDARPLPLHFAPLARRRAPPPVGPARPGGSAYVPVPLLPGGLFVLELDTESHAPEPTDSPHRRAYVRICSVEVSTSALIRGRHQAVDPLMQRSLDAVRDGQRQTVPLDNPRGRFIRLRIPFRLSFAQYPESMIRVSKQALPDIQHLPFGVTEVATNRPKMASELIYRWLLSKVAQILQMPNDERRIERMKPIEVAASPVRNLAISVKHELPERLRLHPHHVVTTPPLMGVLETIRSRSRDTLPARGAASPAAVVSISER
jgi:Tn3 transposase DDE domain